MLNVNQSFTANSNNRMPSSFVPSHAVSQFKSATTLEADRRVDTLVRPKIKNSNNYFIRGLTTAIGFLAISAPAEASIYEALQPSVVAAEILPVKIVKPIAAHFEEAWNEMQEYQSLDDGWDGPESLAPSRSAIAASLSLLKRLPIDVLPPEATASADGAVGWFWKNENIYVSIEFLSSNQYAYFARTADKQKVAKGKVSLEVTSIPSTLMEIIRMA